MTELMALLALIVLTGTLVHFAVDLLPPPEADDFGG